MAENPIQILGNKLGKEWRHIVSAQNRTRDGLTSIKSILDDHRMITVDTSFVVFGSLAREESTVNSDVDWTLLIDGQARPEHLKIAQGITRRFSNAKLGDPNPTGVFGKLAFSHPIVHQIGGSSDTNENTTQRVLLLLESKAVGEDGAYRRVIQNVLNRYLDDDISFLTSQQQEYKVPRFLLNDIVRYWRTMCVDYASKHRERQGQGWALRNAKLRMSRKLIFVSGLLTCFSCRLQHVVGENHLFGQLAGLEPLLNHLTSYVSQTPLQILAAALDRHASNESAIRIMGSYDRFLEILSDGDRRTALQELASEHARTDRTFQEIRDISAEFQKGLTSFFFDESDDLRKLTREFGVF